MVLQPVNPVDEKVIPDHKQHRRDEHPRPPPRVLVHLRVKQALAPHLGQEEGQGEDVDEGHGAHGRVDLLADLVLEEARVVLQPPVEDEVVGQGAEDKVQRRGAQLRDGQDGHDLPQDPVARPLHVCGDEVGVRLVQHERVEEVERGVHGCGRVRQVRCCPDWGGEIQCIGRWPLTSVALVCAWFLQNGEIGWRPASFFRSGGRGNHVEMSCPTWPVLNGVVGRGISGGPDSGQDRGPRLAGVPRFGVHDATTIVRWGPIGARPLMT